MGGGGERRSWGEEEGGTIRPFFYKLRGEGAPPVDPTVCSQQYIFFHHSAQGDQRERIVRVSVYSR